MPTAEKIVTDTKTECNKYSKYIHHINKSKKNIPIGELLRSMDKDGNSNVSSNELYQGVLEAVSDSINFGYKTKNIFSKTSAEKAATTEGKAISLGIDINSIKKEIQNNIGKDGIDLNNLTASISKFLGFDIQKLINIAKAAGINIDITKLTISKAEEILDDLEEIAASPFTKHAINDITNAFENAKSNNLLATAGYGLQAYGSLLLLNATNDESAKYTKKIYSNVANNVQKTVHRKLGNNWFSDCASSCAGSATKAGCYLVTGTCFNDIKNVGKAVWNWIF